MAHRTLKADRELVIKLATKLGHEMGPWGQWFDQNRGICFCKLCNDWAGVNQNRDWKYSKTFYMSFDGITGPAIEENHNWRKTKCFGVKRRAIYKTKHKEYKECDKIILTLKKRCKHLQSAVNANKREINKNKYKSRRVRLLSSIDVSRKNYFLDKLSECKNLIVFLSDGMTEDKYVNRL